MSSLMGCCDYLGSVRFGLVASDLDGTLLRNDDTLSPRTKAAIDRVVERSVFVMATGRPPRWVHPVAELLGHRGLAVCSNGALIMDLTDESIVDSQLLTPAQARLAVALIQSIVPGAGIAVDRLSGFGHDPGYTSSYTMPKNVRVAPIDELIGDEPMLKVMFRHKDMDTNVLARLVAELGDGGAVTYGAAGPTSGMGASAYDSAAPLSLANTLIEIQAPGVSKAAALARVCDRFGVDHSSTIAFGDMPNDIEMLTWASHGVAMANAHIDVKIVANEITVSNDEDGVAEILERELG
jgi:hydroxymethylpyrimidine pyrophosphatase-like HAD family hydrolase